MHSFVWVFDDRSGGCDADISGASFHLRNMEVLDVEIPLLSMHVPYEMSSKEDLLEFLSVYGGFYAM